VLKVSTDKLFIDEGSEILHKHPLLRWYHEPMSQSPFHTIERGLAKRGPLAAQHGYDFSEIVEEQSMGVQKDRNLKTEDEQQGPQKADLRWDQLRGVGSWI
jgi:hypothetical protein